MDENSLEQLPEVDKTDTQENRKEIFVNSFMAKATSIYNLEQERVEDSPEEFSNRKFTERFLTVFDRSTIVLIEEQEEDRAALEPVYFSYWKHSDFSPLRKYGQLLGVKMRLYVDRNRTRRVDEYQKKELFTSFVLEITEDDLKWEDDKRVFSALMNGYLNLLWFGSSKKGSR
jgi:hypothetical protein